MKLPQKTITKKQRKRYNKRKFSVFLIILGLVLVALSLFYFAFFDNSPLYINPLSKDQSSLNLQIEKKLKEKKISYESVTIFSDLSYIIEINSESEVIIDPNKDIDQQLSSLQLITSQLTIEGKTFRRLDFRYQKPIIKFQ